MSKHVVSSVRCWVLLAVSTAAMLFTSACQYQGSFEDMRCAQASDCPGTSSCVEGYCVAEAELGDVSSSAVAAIELTPESVELAEGEVVELSIDAFDAQGAVVADAEIQWETTDATVASVSENGVITAESVGTAVITASSEGQLDSTKVTVTPVPAQSIAVEPASLELKPGESSALSARVLDEAGEELVGRQILWSTESPGIAFVDDSGEVTAVNPGSTTITATSGDVEQTVDVEVLEADLVAIELTPNSIELTEGDDYALLALVRDEFGELVENAPITWTSSDENVATVDTSGVVQAVAEGTATITAESGSAQPGSTQPGTIQATASVDVSPTPVASIELTPRAATLETGTTLALDATALAADSTELTWPTITFSSSNDTLASVDPSGVVTAHQAGTVAITATAGGVERSAAITVIPTQATGLSVSPSTSDIEVGLSVDLDATVQDINGNTISNPFVVWESSDTTIALVDATGEVFGVGVGSATITARTEGGIQATATVNVAERSASTLDLRPQSATIEETQTLELDATVRDSDGSILENRTITYSSSDSSVAAVDASGVVTGLAPGGPVTITAASGNASQTVDVTVDSRSVVRVDVSPQLDTIAIDDTTSLTATPRAIDGSALLGRTITWTSDDDTIASVGATGGVTGVAKGVTLIRATVDAIQGFASVRVTAPPVATVEINEGDQTVSKGASVQLSATTRDSGGATLTGRLVSWSSTDTSVAVVDSSGTVTGVSGGQATITATSGSASDTVSVTVTSNSAPTATARSLTTSEDTPRSIPLDGSDPENDPLTFSIDTLPDNGTLSNFDATNGSVTYTPNQDYNGSDSFTFTATDTSGATGSASISLTITSVNDAPVAADDADVTNEDSPVTVDVLANDDDVEGDALSVSIASQPANGSVGVNADETITYTPATDFYGTDSFTYTVSDGVDSDTATVTISVDPINDTPVATNDAATTDEDQQVTVNVLANDSDADDDTLSVVLVSTPTSGTASSNGDGTITYTPNDNFNGDDSFTYDVSDGNQTVTATVEITVNPVNDAPVAVPDSDTVAEDGSVVIDVVANDTDVDGDARSVASIDLAPAYGMATDNLDGTITYTPDPDFNGDDFFIYTVTDGNGGFDSTYVEITVTSVNDAPVANAGPDQTVNQNDTVQLDGSASSDVDGDALSYTWSVTSEPAGPGITLSDANVVSPSFVADNTGDYVFTLTVSDGTDSHTDTVTITSQ